MSKMKKIWTVVAYKKWQALNIHGVDVVFGVHEDNNIITFLLSLVLWIPCVSNLFVLFLMVELFFFFFFVLFYRTHLFLSYQLLMKVFTCIIRTTGLSQCFHKFIDISQFMDIFWLGNPFLASIVFPWIVLHNEAFTNDLM